MVRRQCSFFSLALHTGLSLVRKLGLFFIASSIPEILVKKNQLVSEAGSAIQKGTISFSHQRTYVSQRSNY